MEKIVIITLRRNDSDGESMPHAPLSLPGRGAGDEGFELVLNPVEYQPEA
jgi:hypothetical protein